MDELIIIKFLKSLNCEERFNVIIGPQRKMIESNLKCRILTLPLNKLPYLGADAEYFMVTDKNKHLSYLAVLERINN
jgi:hypothetical protein